MLCSNRTAPRVTLICIGFGRFPGLTSSSTFEQFQLKMLHICPTPCIATPPSQEERLASSPLPTQTPAPTPLPMVPREREPTQFLCGTAQSMPCTCTSANPSVPARWCSINCDFDGVVCRSAQPQCTCRLQTNAQTDAQEHTPSDKVMHQTDSAAACALCRQPHGCFYREQCRNSPKATKQKCENHGGIWCGEGGGEG
jgi:hypothetical protein